MNYVYTRESQAHRITKLTPKVVVKRLDRETLISTGKVIDSGVTYWIDPDEIPTAPKAKAKPTSLKNYCRLPVQKLPK